MSQYNYYIIFPGGDRSKLKVLEKPDGVHDLDDYTMASRQHFTMHSKACVYAKELAMKHSLTFINEAPSGLLD